MSESRISGPEFVELMERYGIKPMDLGIKPRYKNMLKRGERRPSKELVDRLMKLIGSKTKKAGNNEDNEGVGARRLAWLGRRPYEAEVRGSNPRGPTTQNISSRKLTITLTVH